MVSLIQWFLSLFQKKTPHVLVPINLIGSADYVQPTVDNVEQNWWKYFSLPYNTQEEQLPGGQGTLMEDNCVVQSAVEVIQALMNYYIKNNNDIVSDFIKKNYLNDLGCVKLSVRYSSVMSGVQLGKGADIATVWNQFDTYGIIPESLYPDPEYPFTWQEYMQPVPQKIIDFGKNSTNLFRILWSVVQNDVWTAPNIALLQKSLVSSPIAFAGAIGSIDSKGIEQYQGKPVYEHAGVVGSIDSNIEVLDNYPVGEVSGGSMTRKLSLSFPIPCAIIAQLKIV